MDGLKKAPPFLESIRLLLAREVETHATPRRYRNKALEQIRAAALAQIESVHRNRELARRLGIPLPSGFAGEVLR